MILRDSSDPTIEVMQLMTSAKDETSLFLFNQYILTVMTALRVCFQQFREPSSLPIQYGMLVPVKELLH